MKSKVFKPINQTEYEWERVVNSSRTRCGEDYAVMFSITAKEEKRFVVHFSDDIVNRMKWRKGDKVTVLICHKTMSVAFKRVAGKEYGMTLTGKGTERARTQFHNDVAKEIGVSGRVIIKDDGVSISGELLIVSMTWWFNEKEKA